MITTDVQALRQHFIANWPNDVPVFYALQPIDDQPVGIYTRFTVNPGASQHYVGSAANGAKLQLGRVWLQIFAPLQDGDTEVLRLIDLFAGIYRNWSSYDDAIRCQTEDVSGPFADPSGRYLYTVSIPWESYRTYQA